MGWHSISNQYCNVCYSPTCTSAPKNSQIHRGMVTLDHCQAICIVETKYWWALIQIRFQIDTAMSTTHPYKPLYKELAKSIGEQWSKNSFQISILGKQNSLRWVWVRIQFWTGNATSTTNPHVPLTEKLTKSIGELWECNTETEITGTYGS